MARLPLARLLSLGLVALWLGGCTAGDRVPSNGLRPDELLDIHPIAPPPQEPRSLQYLIDPVTVKIETDAWVGSGIILTSDGLVLTNEHVASPFIDTAYTVELHDGRRFAGEVLPHYIPCVDLALVQLRGGVPLSDGVIAPVPSRLPAAVWAEMENLPVTGETVYHIGHPQAGFWELARETVTGAYATQVFGADGTGNPSTEPVTYEILETTVSAAKPGFSGGPLFSPSGQVVGVPHAAGNGRLRALTVRTVATFLEEADTSHAQEFGGQCMRRDWRVRRPRDTWRDRLPSLVSDFLDNLS